MICTSKFLFPANHCEIFGTFLNWFSAAEVVEPEC